MGLNPGLTNSIVGSTSTAETTGLLPEVFDYIGCNYAGTTADVYTYKSGGVSGITVATLTVNWTDTTKSVLSTIVRT